MVTETEAIRQNYELGVLAGEAREQQRIIKLLQDNLNFAEWEGIFHNKTENRPGLMADIESIAALIKGEN